MKKLVIWAKGKQRSLVLTAIFLGLLITYSPLLFPGGWGFHSGSSVVKKTVTQLSESKTEEITVTEGSGKTAWDWLSLLGVPLSLALLGAWFQNSQQQQAAAAAKELREQAASETGEEVLQIFFDRISILLVDKNLLGIAAKEDISSEQTELLCAAVDVIRARTLSILRRFENDEHRKTSVIRFLIETEVISKLKLNLSNADLSGANLNRANLSGVNLNKANLNRADLSAANLSGAKLDCADLNRADLICANLSRAVMSGVNLSDAYLYDADLSYANLSYTDLSRAYLSRANLSDADLECADLICADLGGTDLSRAYLSEADLSGAKGLTASQLETALLCRTQLPEGIELDPNRDCERLGIKEP